MGNCLYHLIERARVQRPAHEVMIARTRSVMMTGEMQAARDWRRRLVNSFSATVNTHGSFLGRLAGSSRFHERTSAVNAVTPEDVRID